jgi:Protein of unknown function (DUF3800)
MSARGDRHLRCFGGGPLADGEPVRYVYVDEAGTSAKNDVAVVVGIIIHQDSEWRRVADYLGFLRAKFLPERLQETWAFHATELYSGGKHITREQFPFDLRWRILRRILSVPRKFGLGVVYGYMRKGGMANLSEKEQAARRHELSFGLCLSDACEFIKRQFPGEIATVVAEDCPEMRERIRNVPHAMAQHESERFRNNPFEVMVDAVHFTAKDESAMLQIADACAFALQRYLAEKKHGAELLNAITARTPHVELNAPGGHGGLAFNLGPNPRPAYKGWRAYAEPAL